MPDNVQNDFFSPDWLRSEPVRILIDAASTGVALLQAVRNAMGQIVDFHYQLINPMQQAIINFPLEDLTSLPLTTLYPDGVRLRMLTLLIRVVHSGQPSVCVEADGVDGDVRLYDQFCLKSGDGVLMLVQDVTYRPLSAYEHQQQANLLEAIQRHDSTDAVRELLIALIRGQT